MSSSKAEIAIGRDRAMLEDAVRNLSVGINRSGVDWRDARYQELAAAINDIARDSRNTFRDFDASAQALKRFWDIASED